MLFLDGAPLIFNIQTPMQLFFNRAVTVDCMSKTWQPNKPAKGDRAQWASSLGFILAAAGSAVGLGNIWKFPGKAYEGGGGVYILTYILRAFFPPVQGTLRA